MRTRTTKLSRLTALLLAAAPIAALAQPRPPEPAKGTVAADAQVQAATEQRIAGLQAQLGIMPAQMSQWTAVAQVMRDNAQSTDTLFRQRASGAPSMNAVANMESYAQISRAYADGTEKLATSFKVLYDTLSEPQKQTADRLFQQQAASSTRAVAKAR
jgi:uncharacterized membrane protein